MGKCGFSSLMPVRPCKDKVKEFGALLAEPMADGLFRSKDDEKHEVKIWQ